MYIYSNHGDSGWNIRIDKVLYLSAEDSVMLSGSIMVDSVDSDELIDTGDKVAVSLTSEELQSIKERIK